MTTRVSTAFVILALVGAAWAGAAWLDAHSYAARKARCEARGGQEYRISSTDALCLKPGTIQLVDDQP